MIKIPEIIGNIWSSPTVFSPISYLADTIGSRPTGSVGNIQTVSYLVEQFSELELIVKKQTFEVQIWDYDSTLLEIRGKTKLRAIPFGFSAIGEVKGSILPLVNPNPKQLEKLNFKDKIVTYLDTMGDMQTTGGRGLSRENLITNSAEKGASAFIEVMNKPGGIIERRCLKSEAEIPTVGVSYEDGHLLLRSQSDVSFGVAGQQKKVTAENVIAQTSEKTEKKLILTAHYDTVKDSPGAFDNASGVATLLELARVFSEINKLSYSIEFIGLGANKWHFGGAKNYIDKYMDNTPVLVMNFDNTAKPGGLRYGVLANDMRLFGLTKQLILRFGFNINFNPAPIFGTDAALFHQKNIPVFVINQWKSPTFMNTPYDTLEKLSTDSLKNSTCIAGAILANIQNMAVLLKKAKNGKPYTKFDTEARLE
ncbi:MAG: M28 family peptidase [Candidatus Hodarchaeota archaeon]